VLLEGVILPDVSVGTVAVGFVEEVNQLKDVGWMTGPWLAGGAVAGTTPLWRTCGRPDGSVIVGDTVIGDGCVTRGMAGSLSLPSPEAVLAAGRAPATMCWPSVETRVTV
jgi:hypothetical protein